MRSFDDPAQAIHVMAGDTFSLRLASHPTTGYTWEAEVDPQYLELLGQAFEPGGEAIGGGGQELFHLRAQKAGETEIALAYHRPWSGKALNTMLFRVVIA
ncbi:protease inhibitor I42 family protein [Chloroflexota bacterium]